MEAKEVDVRIENKFVVGFRHLDESLQEDGALDLILQRVCLFWPTMMLTSVVFCRSRSLAFASQGCFVVLGMGQF